MEKCPICGCEYVKLKGEFEYYRKGQKYIALVCRNCEGVLKFYRESRLSLREVDDAETATRR